MPRKRRSATKNAIGRDGPKADIETDQLNVGCTPKGGHWSMAFPLFIANCRRALDAQTLCSVAT
jgi:hypothetical protein